MWMWMEGTWRRVGQCVQDADEMGYWVRDITNSSLEGKFLRVIKVHTFKYFLMKKHP